MNNTSTILQLLTDKNKQRIVSYSEIQPYTLEDLQKYTHLIRQLIIQQSNKKWVLAVEDIFSFTAGFLALASLNCTIILPPNLKQGAIEDIYYGDENILTDKSYESTRFFITSMPPFQATAEILPIHQQISAPTNLPASANCKLQMFTSGSSGEPKSITKTLQNLEEELKVLEKNWGNLTDKTVFFSTVTHLHIYGLLFRLLWPLTTGRPFFNKNYLFPDELTKAMKSYAHITLISSPAHLKRLPEMTTLSSFCSQIKLLVSSGGPLSFETSQAFTAAANLTPLEVFGSTETGGIAWRFQTAENTPWQAFDCIQIKQERETATLSVLSPFIPKPDWYQTTDLIDMVSPILFHLKGRADRIVKIEEKRIGLNHLESKLMETGLVNDSFVTVLYDEAQNNRATLAAIVTLNAKGQELLLNSSWKNIVEMLRRQLGQFFDDILIPRQWRLVNEIPVNAQGKKIAIELKKFFLPISPKQPQILQTEKTATSLNCQLYIPADLFYFQGHFDSFPIIPGVTQIHWAVEYAKENFYIPGKFYQMINIKFKRVIRPGTILYLIIQRDVVKNTLTFSFENAVDKFSSGVIKFKESEEASI